MGHLSGLNLVEGRISPESEDILHLRMGPVFHPIVAGARDTQIFVKPTLLHLRDIGI
jgi:hypothetical protein